MFMKFRNLVIASAIATGLASCVSGTVIKDVDFPATPIDLSKVTKKGRACWKKTIAGMSGNGSVIQAAKNGGISTVYMDEYGTEFEHGGFTELRCTYVYGD